MNRVLVVAEHADGNLNPATARAITCARALECEIDLLVVGTGTESVAEAAARLDGVSRVLRADDARLTHALAATLAPIVAALAGDHTHLIAPATTFGRDLMPRIAGLLGVPQVTDVMAVVDARTFKRPVYAGNVVTTVRVPEGALVVATARGASWAATGTQDPPAPVEPVAVPSDLPEHTRFVELAGGGGDRPDLQSAARVVAGGRGLGSKEHFDKIMVLADKLGAGVGASRAAVDAGFVPNDWQVGQTGKIIAPELYIAIGISGAIQHVTGIKDAGVIVAINKDPDAPIFEVADLGLVGDLFEVLPELERALADE